MADMIPSSDQGPKGAYSYSSASLTPDYDTVQDALFIIVVTSIGLHASSLTRSS